MIIFVPTVIVLCWSYKELVLPNACWQMENTDSAKWKAKATAYTILITIISFFIVLQLYPGVVSLLESWWNKYFIIFILVHATLIRLFFCIIVSTTVWVSRVSRILIHDSTTLKAKLQTSISVGVLKKESIITWNYL